MLNKLRQTGTFTYEGKFNSVPSRSDDFILSLLLTRNDFPENEVKVTIAHHEGTEHYCCSKEEFMTAMIHIMECNKDTPDWCEGMKVVCMEVERVFKEFFK